MKKKFVIGAGLVATTGIGVQQAHAEEAVTPEVAPNTAVEAVVGEEKQAEADKAVKAQEAVVAEKAKETTQAQAENTKDKASVATAEKKLADVQALAKNAEKEKANAEVAKSEKELADLEEYETAKRVDINAKNKEIDEKTQEKIKQKWRKKKR